ncbi:MAG TPA: hypothetical protein PKC43_12125 [Phycisphaerales bacterium]|nr:hypothetical protein [Phycisphaerales bacterium]HMP38179.1 hypothetical protein [Phycisphaerales bacterium]
MGSRGLWVIRGSGVSISGQSVPPPSHLLHLLPRFHALLHGYVSLNGDQKLSFASWVIANGIVDPAMVAGMVELYEWYVATFRRLP